MAEMFLDPSAELFDSAAELFGVEAGEEAAGGFAGIGWAAGDAGGILGGGRILVSRLSREIPIR